MTTGKPHSEWIKESGGLRGAQNEMQYDCVCIWLDATKDVLTTRQTNRVDKMVEEGLVEEVNQISKTLVAYDKEREREEREEREKREKRERETSILEPHVVTPQYEYGVVQSIGYKEILPVLEAREREREERERKEQNDDASSTASPSLSLSLSPSLSPFLSSSSSPSPSLSSEEILKSCIEQVKRVTVRYAKKQLKWIRRRLLGRVGAGLPVYRFNTSSLSLWPSHVLSPSISLVHSFLETSSPPPREKYKQYESGLDSLSLSLSNPHPEVAVDSEGQMNNLDKWKKTHCDVCDRVINGADQWEIHVRSRRHRQSITKMKRKEKLEEYLRKRKMAKVEGEEEVERERGNERERENEEEEEEREEKREKKRKA